MKAVIVNVGDEILIGQVVNSNASWMAMQLNDAGFMVNRMLVVADMEKEILEALTDAEKYGDVILVTGGLGPTKDDITKQTILKYFNDVLVLDAETQEHNNSFFASRNLPMTDLNRQQALLPSKCKKLHNPNGTAPAMWFEKAGKVFVFMPGVPFEMKALMLDQVIPDIRGFFKVSTDLRYKTILTTGMGESFLADRIHVWENNLPSNMKLAYLPQPGIVRLRLSVHTDNEVEAERLLNEQYRELKGIIPELIFGQDDQTMEEVVGELLKNSGCTLSTAESCTGGLVSHLVTRIPGSSDYFKGGVVAYSNEIKKRVLGVSEQDLEEFGAVSKQVVEQMALGVRNLYDTDYALATSGIAGPAGGSFEKPVGTVWMAVAARDHVFSIKYNFGEHRGRNVMRSTIGVMNELRLFLLKK